MMRLDSEIPRNHPEKMHVEGAIRRTLATCPGPWEAWLHVARHKSSSWFLQVRGREGLEHALVLQGPEEQAPHFIEARLREILRDPSTRPDRGR